MLKVIRTKNPSLVQMRRMSQNLAEVYSYGNVEMHFWTIEGMKTKVNFWLSFGHPDDKGETLRSWEELLCYYFEKMGRGLNG